MAERCGAVSSSSDRHLRELQPLRASAAVLVHDGQGRVLVLRTTYKDHWEIPGGGMEPRETPREAAEREALEELGVAVRAGELLCVDHAPPRPERSIAMVHFVFECLHGEAVAASPMRHPADEIVEHRLVGLPEAVDLLGPRLGRRVWHAAEAAKNRTTAYLENGDPVLRSEA